MRIGIDLTALWRPMTGQESVAIGMTQALLRYDQKNEYSLFFSGEVHQAFEEFAGRFQPRILPLRHEALTKNVFLPFQPELRHLDFFHFPIFPPPFWCPCPHAWILPDAVPWLLPKTMRTSSRVYVKILGHLAMKRCRYIVTDTYAALAELRGVFGSLADKVRVIYPGIRKIFRPLKDESKFAEIRQSYSLPREFVLCVSTLEPRKNIIGLIRALAKAKSECTFGPSLVIAGKKRWQYAEMFSEVMKLGLQESVVFTDYVPDEDLVALYNMARAFVYPSFYEGFGLPCIEAMAVGCPVVTSDRGALMEVTGEAALHAKPEDVSSIANAMRRACQDEVARNQLIAAGRERCKAFSWQSYADSVLDATEKALQGLNQGELVARASVTGGSDGAS